MRKTILIGLDGCCFDVLNRLMADGRLPTLSEIISEGSRAVLRSTIPPNSLPAWTSIFTGVNPGKHGIIDSILRINGEIKVATSRDRAVPSLWKILDAWGVKQIVVNEPVTYPPAQINGVMLTGFSTPPAAQNYIYPFELREEVDRACGGYMPDLELDFEGVISKDRNKGLKMMEDFAKKTFEAACYLAKNYEWDLLSCIFTSTDRLLHFYFDDPNAIISHLKLIDGMISKMLELEESNVLIVSDHGFGPLKKSFYINSWLKKLSYLKERRTVSNMLLTGLGLNYRRLSSLLTKLKLYGIAARLVPTSVKKAIPTDAGEPAIDHKESLFYSLSVNGGIYVNDIRIKTSTQIDSLIDVLRSLSIGSERPIEQVFRKKEILWGNCTGRAPEILFLPAVGYEISPRLLPSILEPSKATGDIRTGTHRPRGIFLAFGPDIKRGKLPHNINTWDIAPTILHEFGLPIPDYMDGWVLKEIFKERSKILTRPVKLIKWDANWRLLERIRRIKLRKPKG